MYERVRVQKPSTHWTSLLTVHRLLSLLEVHRARRCPLTCQIANLPNSESLRLDTNLSGASSGYAVHVCAAARPRASCPCHWGCRLLFSPALRRAGVRWAKPDLAWEFGSPGHVGAALTRAQVPATEQRPWPPGRPSLWQKRIARGFSARPKNGPRAGGGGARRV
jgi:hypothetical protein